MKAIVQTAAGDSNVLELKSLQKPSTVTGRDLLVKIHSFALNPIDYKMRKSQPSIPDFILGWDASGVVDAVSGDAKLGFKVGDEVVFAGSLARNGTYAEYTLVDERIVAKKPTGLSFSDSAAFPLVSLTAYEALVETLGLRPGEDHSNKSLLIVNGAGGVGSLAIQLAVKYLKVGKVIATASRPETIKWCRSLGAHYVINHHKDLKEQVEAAAGLKEIDHALLCHGNEETIGKVVEFVKPFGHIVSIVPVDNPLPLQAGFLKSIRFSWTLMFTKSMFGVNMESQGEILKLVGDLFSKGVFSNIATRKETFKSIEQLRTLHDELEGGKFHGKVVVSFQ